MKKIQAPAQNEYAMYYDTYLDKVSKDISVLDELKANAKAINNLYKSCTKEQLSYQYAPGKWTMKDILNHLIDTERVFLYRAMRFARKDRTPLPFFDENEFAIHAEAGKKPVSKLLKEYNTTRLATIAFFNNQTAAALREKGIASQYNMSVRACAWIIYAHELHHWGIIRERYLAKENA